MAESEMNREELENQAQEAAEQQEAQSTPYVERPRSQRILAWVLLVLVILGVLLYYGWIAGILH